MRMTVWAPWCPRQKGRQVCKRAREVARIHEAGSDALEPAFLESHELGTGSQVTMASKLPTNHARDEAYGLVVRMRSATGKVKVDDGMHAVVLHIVGVVELAYGESVEEAAAFGNPALDRRLKEALQHAQERGLAEAPRPAVERNAASVHEVFHREAFVNVGEASQHILEAL
jgi:hypothetical protein